MNPCSTARTGWLSQRCSGCLGMSWLAITGIEALYDLVRNRGDRVGPDVAMITGYFAVIYCLGPLAAR